MSSESASTSKCPVDHSALPSASASGSACPVDHTQRSKSTWASLFASSQPSSSSAHSLSTDRQISSIPRGTYSDTADIHESPASGSESKWVYPSEAQFFAAMARKEHNPRAADMKTIVPIHNAVNERAWAEILKWEDGKGGEKCGGIRLVNFKGRPGDVSPKARWKMMLGYTAPFDRHDWVVDRCGTKTRYIIDFYTGRTDPATNQPSFYLDARPALDNFEGVKMRVGRLWSSWLGN